MATLTAANIIKDAMSLCGAIAIDENPTTSEYTMALRTLNVMIDRWSSQRLLLRSTTTVTIALLPNVQSYSLTTKPISIQSGFVRDTSNTDSAISLINRQVFDNFDNKSYTVGKPEYVMYDPGASQQTTQTGTVYVYYTPDTNYTLYLEADMYLTEFTATTDNVTFEPAYYEALIYNLAERMWRHLHSGATPVPIDIQMIARDSLNNLRTINSDLLVAGMELPGKVSKFNIYSGE